MFSQSRECITSRFRLTAVPKDRLDERACAAIMQILAVTVDCGGQPDTPQRRGSPNGASPKIGNVEAGDEILDLVTFYSQNLAVPKRRKPNDPDVLAGKKLFYQARCVQCHQPKFVTGTLPGQPHLSGQLIWPYTDMLLHDMGEGLADNRPEGVANGREWRTAPLWGIGLTPTAAGFAKRGFAKNRECRGGR